MKLNQKIVAILAGLLAAFSVQAQLIYGNTFPYWNVNGPLTVTGVSTLSGGQVFTGSTSITSPDIVTSITTPTVSFTAFAGATTLMTLGGTGASASTFFPSTLDASSSVTGAVRTSGGISAAKAANFGTTLAVGTTSTFTGVTTHTTGIKGTITNDSAATTIVGELLTTQLAAGSAVAGAATTASANVTSVSLTAGDWDVHGTCSLVWSGITATVQRCGLGTTTDVQASQAGGAGIGTDPLTVRIATFGTTLSGTTSLTTPVTRVSLAATTTIYLVAGMTYSAGTFTQYGSIRARRMR